MATNFRFIPFDRQKNPGIDFDIFPIENFYQVRGLDHNPEKPHRIEFYLIAIISTGTGKHTIDFKEYEYKPGALLTIRKDQIHCFNIREAEGYFILFTEEFILSYLENASARKIPEIFNELLYEQITELEPEKLRELLVIVNQIVREFNRERDTHSSGIIRNFLQILVSKIHRIRKVSENEQDHKYIHQFLDFQQLIEQHCCRHRSVQYYAEALNISAKTLNNITGSVLNESPKSLIDKVLILQIKRMLINSTLSVKEIAYQSGFDEPTNLFKFFKRHTGHTPEAFRAEHAI